MRNERFALAAAAFAVFMGVGGANVMAAEPSTEPSTPSYNSILPTPPKIPLVHRVRNPPNTMIRQAVAAITLESVTPCQMLPN